MSTTPRRKAAPPAPTSVELDETPAVEPEAAPEIPTPTKIKAAWFPAIVQLPGETTVHHKAKVYAAVEGLYVYFAVPVGEGSVTPDFFSPVDYTAVPKPPTGWRARNGFRIPTEAGPVTITLDSGCGCSHPLKRWVPPFATKIVVW